MNKNGITRTSAGLRESLFDALQRLRDGDMECQDAKAFAGLAKEICRTVTLEMEVQKLRLQYPADASVMVPCPLQLGTEPNAEQHKLPQVRTGVQRKPDAD